MALAFIGLGSNLGDGRCNLWCAWECLGKRPGLVPLALSHPYQSRPVNKPEYLAAGRPLGEQPFINGVGVLESRMTPLALLAMLQEVEKMMGRQRAVTPDRPIDLDLLYFDQLVLDSPELVLPHPAIEKRLFVLAPLEELAPEHRHPRLGLTTREMRRRLPASEETQVSRLEWPTDRHWREGCS